MDIEKYIEKHQKYLEENKLKCFGGNSDKNVFWSFLRQIGHLVTGFEHARIQFPDKPEYCDDSLTKICIDYHLLDKNGKGEKYQYNHLTVKNYKIKEIDGDGEKYIKKIFEFINVLDEKTFEKWQYTIDHLASLTYYHRCDVRDTKSEFDKYVKLSDETWKKFRKLDAIHKSLLYNYPVKKIVEILNDLHQYWEIENFQEKEKSLFHPVFTGSFSNDFVPTYKSDDDNDVIFFPDESRHAMCSEYLLVEDIDEIIKLKEGDTFNLIFANSKKLETTLYKILEIKSKSNIAAIQKVGSNKIEFIASYYDAASCYDALFSVNKQKVKNWRKKKVYITF